MNRAWTAILALSTAAAPLLAHAATELPAAPTTQVTVDWFKQIDTAIKNKPDAAAARKLVDQIRTANPAERELLIERLLPLSDVAAEATVALFAEPPLATRLAALELLEAWNAPIKGIDPWAPATITPQRLEALKTWAKSPNRPVPSTAPTTSPSSASIASELARLIASQDDQEALLIRIRLARFGPAILPEVVAAIREHDDDTSLERLTALRYRLVCSDALAISWPDGIDRLASRDSQVRRKAVQELQSRAKAQDLLLLRELFSDVDPFVRELALATIQGIGGNEARNALLALLEDPDANVRAAVLKQLTENPNPELVRNIVGYAQREQDPDLVLHAVRTLSAMKGPAAVKGLVALMQHPSWQVRAEAADRAKEAINSLSEAQKADVYIAMIVLLDDKDSFVVSRALECLQRADILATLEPMLRVADTHPELTAEVIKAISSGSNMRAKATPRLRQFCRHKDPAVRAAAIMGLCQIATSSVETELLTALRDPDPQVHFAGTRAFYSLLEDQRPYAARHRLTPYSNYSGRTTDTPKPDAWLKKFQSGKDRPAWMGQAADLCRAMLDNPDAERQLFAALPLIALFHDPQATQVVLSAVERDSHIAEDAAHILLWLPADQRGAALDRLLAAAKAPDQKASIVGILSGLSDDAATGRLWTLLQSPDATPQIAAAAYDALRSHYVGERYYDPSAIAQLDRASLLAELKPRAEKGTDLERSVALCMIIIFDAPTASNIAGAIRLDPKSGEWLRIDALQIRLLALPVEQARKDAVEILNSGDNAGRKIVLPYLAGLGNRLLTFRGAIHVYRSIPDDVTPDNKPILPQYPDGLDRKVLTGIISAGDDEQKPMASYLLALANDRSALDAVIAYWRAHQDNQWRKLAFRAIAVANDDALTPVLQEMYGGMSKDDYEMREFYWTIRSIKGAEILKLRKQIRDDVGMDRLR